MSSQKYRTALLLTTSIATVLLLLVCIDVIWPQMQTSAASSPADSNTVPVTTEEGTATLSPAILKTWTHIDLWHSDSSWCSGDFVTGFSPEEVAGSIVAGYRHTYDKGKPVLGCPSGNNSVHRGSVWFDLSDIVSKAPPLHVAVQSATLHFKGLSGACPGDVLVGTADWMRGYSGELVPGDPLINRTGIGAGLSTLGPCGTGGCNVDVTRVVNNWVRGEEHGGYPNYGFVIKGSKEADLHWEDNDSCLARYGDFSLTVKYTYDKAPAAKLPDTYPLECRGIDTLKVRDVDGLPVGFRWIAFDFIPGTGPAKNGLLPGQCSWLDRGMRAGEPARLAQPIEGAVAWIKDLNSSDSYWTFNVYNAGAQLQATGAERSKKFFVPLLRTNVALASNGATASAQDYTRDEVYPGSHFQPSYAIDGLRYLHLAPPPNDLDGFWRDEHGLPSWLQIDFSGSKTIAEVDVFTVADYPDAPKQMDPSESLTFKNFGATAFDVEYWDGSTWRLVPGGRVGRGKFGPVSPNDKVWTKFKGFTVTTTKIRVLVYGSPDKVARIAEVEAWTP